MLCRLVGMAVAFDTADTT